MILPRCSAAGVSAQAAIPESPGSISIAKMAGFQEAFLTQSAVTVITELAATAPPGARPYSLDMNWGTIWDPHTRIVTTRRLMSVMEARVDVIAAPSPVPLQVPAPQ